MPPAAPNGACHSESDRSIPLNPDSRTKLAHGHRRFNRHQKQTLGKDLLRGDYGSMHTEIRLLNSLFTVLSESVAQWFFTKKRRSRLEYFSRIYGGVDSSVEPIMSRFAEAGVRRSGFEAIGVAKSLVPLLVVLGMKNRRAFVAHGLAMEQLHSLGETRSTQGGKKLQNSVREMMIVVLISVCVWARHIFLTPTQTIKFTPRQGTLNPLTNNPLPPPRSTMRNEEKSWMLTDSKCNQYGPFTYFELEQKYRVGEINGDTLCYPKFSFGFLSGWKPLRKYFPSFKGSTEWPLRRPLAAEQYASGRAPVESDTVWKATTDSHAPGSNSQDELARLLRDE